MRISVGNALVGSLALAALASFVAAPPAVFAANATVLDTDPNVDGLGFGMTDAFTFGIYGQDATASLQGNDFLVQSQNGVGGGSGAGISIPVSNGENGIDVTFDGATNGDQNDDPQNTTAPNSVFATIGNTAVVDPLHGSVAKLVNDLLPERRTDFWRDVKYKEYFDGCIRDELQARRAYRYTLTQAVRHGVAQDWREYSHTRVNVEVELAIRRSHELKAFTEGVPYKRYLRKPK